MSGSYYEGRNYIPKTVHKGKHAGKGGPRKSRGCCSMVAAARAVRRGRYRLARRYVAMSGRRIGALALTGGRTFGAAAGALALLAGCAGTDPAQERPAFVVPVAVAPAVKPISAPRPARTSARPAPKRTTHKPAPRVTTEAPAGGVHCAPCKDGTVTHKAGHPGACSRHGGLA